MHFLSVNKCMHPNWGVGRYFDFEPSSKFESDMELETLITK